MPEYSGPERVAILASIPSVPDGLQRDLHEGGESGPLMPLGDGIHRSLIGSLNDH